MNDLQKKFAGWKVEREVDEHNESYSFREGYVKAMCDAINAVKILNIGDVSFSFTEKELIEFVNYSNKFTDNSTIKQHIEMWKKWEELENQDKPLNPNES